MAAKEQNANMNKFGIQCSLPNTQTQGVNVNIKRIITPAKYDAKTA